MKKTKLLGVTALLLSLGLSGCLGGGNNNGGGKTNKKTDKYDTTSEGHWELDENGDRISSVMEPHVWEEAPNGVGSKKPKEATCLMAGQIVKQCKVCGRSEYEPVPALGHDMQDVEDGGKKATCTEAGRIHQKCSRCGKEEDRDSTALGHDLKPVATNRDGITKSDCSRCDSSEITLDLSKTDFGWKWASDNGGSAANEKCGSSSTQINCGWNDIGSIITDGTYNIALEVKMTSSGHTDRYWFNHAKFNKEDSASSPDTSSQADYRYDFVINDTTTIGLTNDKTYDENGMSTSDYKMVEVVHECTITGATKFALHHGSIGFSLCVKSIKLTKVA